MGNQFTYYLFGVNEQVKWIFVKFLVIIGV